MAFNNSEICLLCGKTQKEVKLIVQGKFGCVCDECISDAFDVINGEDEESIDSNIKLSTPSQIKTHLDQYVIGQDDAKRTLSVAVYNHYKRLKQDKKSDVEIQKSNILMIGSTGSGKTYLAQSLAKFLGVPFAIADATTLTQAGYVGEDVENILLRLLENADYNVQLAEQGIIYIDEIDKIARKTESTSISRDVSGEGVQQALLKIIEGTISKVPLSGGRKHPQAECVEIDTSKILFICGGAFDGIEKINHEEVGNNPIGFGADIKSKTNIGQLNFKQSDVQQHDLVKYGLMPELIGRLPIVTALSPLSEEDLLRILTEPRNALVKQYQELLAMDKVKLEFEESALHRVAELAINKNIGARGLRSIIEKAMQKVMFDVPDMANAKKVVVTSGVIDGTEDAIVYGARNRKIA
ncbi:ATP-dependent Clp protease ATP-binding subunit ClpX [Lacrimispora indolis]|uniref:ATP-dependent Clp protease ATP-binding subunit ClpX n=1 Tax=Lacrimispora indolis TaxID=69825 RepID=UPI00040D707B|nr:ATP-dependent Clp protease ATP-binding subunit ClpX [[Clostridium] methoxybenzovorans]